MDKPEQKKTLSIPPRFSNNDANFTTTCMISFDTLTPTTAATGHLTANNANVLPPLSFQERGRG